MSMEEPREGRCELCGEKSFLIARVLGLCRRCIIERFSEALPRITMVHAKIRRSFGLPYPVLEQFSACTVCVHRCGGEGVSFCGLLEDGKRWAGTGSKGLLEWYYDDLPTNCVATPFCPERGHFGYQNLAVFYAGCSFHCLFCQNWHFHTLLTERKPLVSVQELLKAVHPRVACVCFFGGDPGPQVAHALAFARKVWKRLRICWETNGAVHPGILQVMYRLSCESGGMLKVDIKAFDERVHLALTGVTNKRTLENFQWLAEESKKYDRPTVVASTLLVPGYVTEDEVASIAAFIARINPNIPYVLLGFAPNFFFDNLPTTSIEHAEKALRKCKEVGLKNVSVGNRFLLSFWYS
ncbi:radical SAM protein [Candidatus Caldatribacterium sp.]|uniref:radical SAM protein n=1 Tax=Candidatus Caldatribacterium sp. TaxID=2282143 RepID=UPI0038738122